MITWGKQRCGTGSWLRGQTEHCLLFSRGKPVLTLTTQSTLLLAPGREHSRKPDEFYALVASLCPGRRLELFARERRRGWTSWGAETDRFNPSRGEAA
jgi:N6-adenosine-specific RNA methylase IME4